MKAWSWSNITGAQFDAAMVLPQRDGTVHRTFELRVTTAGATRVMECGLEAFEDEAREVDLDQTCVACVVRMTTRDYEAEEDPL